MTSIPLLPKARKVWFRDDMLYIGLNDGREVGVPLAWFPLLQDATKEEREDWRFGGEGLLIRWDSIDLEVPVDRILH